jgi:hypothetical protein
LVDGVVDDGYKSMKADNISVQIAKYSIVLYYSFYKDIYFSRGGCRGRGRDTSGEKRRSLLPAAVSWLSFFAITSL